MLLLMCSYMSSSSDELARSSGSEGFAPNSSPTTSRINSSNSCRCSRRCSFSNANAAWRALLPSKSRPVSAMMRRTACRKNGRWPLTVCQKSFFCSRGAKFSKIETGSVTNKWSLERYSSKKHSATTLQFAHYISRIYVRNSFAGPLVWLRGRLMRIMVSASPQLTNCKGERASLIYKTKAGPAI